MTASHIAHPRQRGPGQLLGALSVAPVAVGTLLVWSLPKGQWIAISFDGLMIFCAVLVAFFAGARFGVEALPRETGGRIRDIVLALLPPVTAFATLTLPHPAAGVGLIAVMVAHVLWDVMAADTGRLPEWYARLRLWLTGTTGMLLLAAMVGFAQRG